MGITIDTGTFLLSKFLRVGSHSTRAEERRYLWPKRRLPKCCHSKSQERVFHFSSECILKRIVPNRSERIYRCAAILATRTETDASRDKSRTVGFHWSTLAQPRKSDVFRLVYPTAPRSILISRQDNFTSARSAAIFPYQRFLFRVATTPTSGAIDFSIDQPARDKSRHVAAAALP